MKQRCQRLFGWGFLFLMLIVVENGCASPLSPGTSDPSPQADLTAMEVVVERRRSNEPVELQKNASIDIQVDDQVSVKEQGRGLLRFPDRLLIEIFKGTDTIVQEARLEPGGFVFVRLKQIFGHTRTEIESLADARVTVETDYATITAIDSNSEFMVCHAPELTCMVALAGEVEVQAQGEIVTVEGGEATYIFPGQPPQPATCANMAEVEQWLAQKRGPADVDPLGALVAGWPQRACGEPTAEATEPTPARTGMVKIEGGLYKIGVLQPDEFHAVQQEISLPGFWIDQYEVTNAEYRKFLDETGRPSTISFVAGYENHPVKGVAWEDAAAYCDWAGKRLPTESEWEVAARGPDAAPPLYPWGADPGAGGQINLLPLTDTYEVGTWPFNRSPYGVYDMAGNVWEWVGEAYGPAPEGSRLLRGGRYGLLRDMAYRQLTAPNDQQFVSVAGFRCAANLAEGE